MLWKDACYLNKCPTIVMVLMCCKTHHHPSLNHKGRWGTTDDFASSFLHFSLISTALWDLANSRPVHSLMLSSHLFLCLPCLLSSLSLCLARWFWPDLMNGRHDHTNGICVSLQCSGLRVVRLPAGSCHILPRWQHGLCMKCVVSCGSTSFPWLVLFFGAPL